MAIRATCADSAVRLLQMSGAAILQQTLYAAAKLGVADLVDGRTISEIATHLNVSGPALLRVMRFLASQGVFEEEAPGVFTNSELSQLLRSDAQGSLRSFVIMRGSSMFFAPIGEILYSIETGLPSRQKLYGKNGFEQLQEDPEMARIFDDAMTDLSRWMGPAIAASYDFGAWGSVMDVGGGNGILLADILRAHPRLHGVLADVPAVIERAKQKGFLAGDLEGRSKLQTCDFFRNVPKGCRAYLMKNVIHDWNDERAHQILVNCRRAVPEDGALLLAQWSLPRANVPSAGRYTDIAMMVSTGGRERDIDEYRDLLAGARFVLNRVIPVPGDYSIIEALPV